MKFFDQDHLTSRLQGCLISWQGKPAYVSNTSFKQSGSFLHLNTISQIIERRGYTIVRADDPEVSYLPLPLGFSAIPGEKVSFSRSPKRMWKIGLTEKNIITYSYPKNRDNGTRFFPINALRTNLNNDILAAIDRIAQNQFTGIEAAYNIVTDKKSVVNFCSFSRNHALATITPDKVALVDRFRGQIGTYKPDTGFVLENKFMFMKEKMAQYV